MAECSMQPSGEYSTGVATNAHLLSLLVLEERPPIIIPQPLSVTQSEVDDRRSEGEGCKDGKALADQAKETADLKGEVAGLKGEVATLVECPLSVVLRTYRIPIQYGI
jgi:hypothetical protein